MLKKTKDLQTQDFDLNFQIKKFLDLNLQSLHAVQSTLSFNFQIGKSGKMKEFET